MDIPKHPESRGIDIGDKPVFDDLLARMKPKASDYTFTNLFLWGTAKGYGISMLDGHILVRVSANAYFQPVGPDPERIIKSLIESEDATFRRVEEDVAGKLGGFSVEEDRGNFDYVYEREKLIKLDGAKLYPKRSFAEKAMRYGPEIKPLCEGDSCLMLQDEWCNERSCMENPVLAAENRAVSEIFLNRKELHVMFVSILIDGKVAAFAAGEPLNDDTFVTHMEKGDTRYKGIYQLINREFARRVPGEYRYINREQDLGIEGLRKAKKSYYPAFMVKKFTVKK